MKSGFSALAVGILALAGYGLSPNLAVRAGGPADKDAARAPQSSDEKGKKEKPRLPGQALWDLQALEGPYTIVSTQYDPDKHQVLWVLEAKKQVKCPGYHALFLDPDKVQVADFKIEFTPSKTEYNQGARIGAVLRLPGRDDFQETNTVTIQAYK